jgi:hypothetical protein
MSRLLSAVMAAHWIACEKLVSMISTLLQQTKSTVTRTNSSLALMDILLQTPVSIIPRYDVRRLSHFADEAQLYQKRFNFSGPFVITHEQHEANSAAWSGVNTTEDVSTYLRIFFPAITDDVINQALELYPESDYSSPGLRFSDMKQSFDLTAHNLALTQALNNQTWNAMVALDQATHGTDQSYYCEHSSSVL